MEQRPSEITTNPPSYHIPMMGLEGNDLFDTNGLSRFDFYLNSVRSTPMNYIHLLFLTLYQAGAALVNSGRAYQPHVVSSIGGKIKLEKLSALDASHEAHRNILVSYYRMLPRQKPDEQHCCDPFHALLLIKIALDHLEIFVLGEIAKELITKAYSLSLSGPLIFPNNSTFNWNENGKALINLSPSLNARVHGKQIILTVVNTCISSKVLELSALHRVMNVDLRQMVSLVPNPRKITTEEINKILEPINTYQSKLKGKIPFWGHQYNSQASTLSSKITSMTTFGEIAFFLRTEMAFFLPDTSLISYLATREEQDFYRSAQANSVEKSGYYKALSSALEIVTEMATNSQGLVMRQMPSAQS